MPRRSYEMNLTEGPILRKILIFALPLALSGILQLLFNAADVIVVGRFVGSTALAAVGSTGSLINLLINLLMGLSVGTNVSVAKAYGARDFKMVSDSVHTAILLSIVSGFSMILVGLLLAHRLLEWMGSPETVIDQATLYMQIYFAGMPLNLLYNFGSAVLRAVGDTRRPMFYLIIAGVVNVILNLFFVIVLKMGVAGVALATIISQGVSAVLVLLSLMRSDGCIHLSLRKLRIYKKPLIEMIRVGLPAGLQGTLFNISNVLIQSSINSFGDIAMAGSAAAGNLEGFVYTSSNAVYQASLSFTSQNYGARQYRRIRTIKWECLIVTATVSLVLGSLLLVLAPNLLRLYTQDPHVIEYGIRKLRVICFFYSVCGMMDVMVGCLRGIGYSIMPMIVSLSGACGFRIIWILTVFAANPTWEILFMSYPISWALTFVLHFICHTIVTRKMPKEDVKQEATRASA
ncbi:MAG: MATE family efflux transporter [Firmicutes bacterium]|nr:MATE family efflux transporter [Bacillota bacterium]